MSKYIFYHIYCCQSTLPILRDQISKIHFSGLYQSIDTIFCFLVGEPDYINECIKCIQVSGSRFKIAELGPNDTTYERFTLLKIRDYITPEDKVLYIHTKGTGRHNSTPVYYWRTCMEYILFSKHKRCLEELETHDIVGVFYLISFQENMNHFSGNMWWANGSYLLRLPNTIDEGYNAPEFYIGLSNPKVKSILNTPLNLYYTPYEFYRYVD